MHEFLQYQVQLNYESFHSFVEKVSCSTHVTLKNYGWQFFLTDLGHLVYSVKTDFYQQHRSSAV